jgi:hypothetical protein
MLLFLVVCSYLFDFEVKKRFVYLLNLIGFAFLGVFYPVIFTGRGFFDPVIFTGRVKLALDKLYVVFGN